MESTQVLDYACSAYSSHELRTYFCYLQTHLTDKRDNRGKRHYLPFVLCGVFLAMLCGKVLPAEIARFLARHHLLLCDLLDFNAPKAISDAQLRRVLSKVCSQEISLFHERYFAWALLFQSSPASAVPTPWISFDGKDLRGTIDGVLGEKRDLCIVRALSQEAKLSFGNVFYQGNKDSEIIEVRKLLTEKNLASACMTFDALHCQVETLDMVEDAKGVYVVQVKGNQATLQEDILSTIQLNSPTATYKEHDKGHGRIESREASFFTTKGIVFEEKWQNAGFKQIISLKRKTLHQKTGKIQEEHCLFITNTDRHSSQEIAQTIRKHWGIESDNWVRDVTFREDKIRSKNNEMIKVLAVFITATLNLIRQQKHKNIKQAIEDYQANPRLAAEIVKNIFL
jgi:predicted transposase YbfD/YdcC